MNPRRMTPEVLAAQEGILAVFVGATVCEGDVDRWWSAAARTEELATATNADDLSIRINDAQVIRMMTVDDIRCIVVYNPDGRIMKSLPRAMRRCIEHVRAQWRAAEKAEVAS